MSRLHDDPVYRGRRRRLFASKCSESVCWRCGEGERRGDPFQAGHLIDGDPASPLDFEHASCNQSAGGRLAHLALMSPASRDWTR